jgi:hypothetical protein
MEVFTGDPNQKVDISSANLEGTGASTEPTTSGLAPQNQQQQQDADPYSILNIAPPGASPQEAEMIKRRANDLYNQDPLLYDDTQTQDLFPGLAPVRQVGGYSGSIVGHSAKYAGGVNVLPVGAILERKKAKARAAAAKAKAMAEIKLPTIDRYKNAVSAQKNLDKSFNQVTNRFWEQAVKDFGPEYAKIALTSTDTALGREYLNFAQDMNTIVAEGDKIYGKAEEVGEDIKKGGVVFSPKMSKLRNAVLQSSQDLETDGELDPFKLARQVKNMKVFDGYYTMEKLVHDRGLDKIKGEILQEAGISDKNADFLTEYSKKTVKFDEYVGNIAKQLAQGELSEQVKEGIYSEKDIEEYLKNVLGREKIETVSAKMMPQGSGGKLTTDQVTSVSKTAGRYQYNYIGNDGVQYQGDISFAPGTSLPSSAKNITIANAKVIDPKTGRRVVLPGNQNIKLIQSGIYQPNKREGENYNEIPMFIADVEQVVKRQVPQTTLNEEKEEVPVLDNLKNQVYKTVEEKQLSQVPLVLDEMLESTIYSNWKSLGFDSLETAKKAVNEVKKNVKNEVVPILPKKGETKMKKTEADDLGVN